MPAWPGNHEEYTNNPYFPPPEDEMIREKKKTA
jgi:hypothetical protein